MHSAFQPSPLASMITEAMRFHPTARLIPIDSYNHAFVRIFQRFADSISSVWAELKGPDLMVTVRCHTLEATYKVKDSFVYDLSPFYIASMSGCHAEEKRVTYVIRNIGHHMQGGGHWQTRLAFGCELFAA